MYFREIARFALRGGRKQEAAKPRLSRWRYFVGLGCILGAVCFSESVNRWLIARGGEFPPGQRVAGWAGVVIVLALWSALFLVDCLRVRASPKQRRRMRRMKAILG